MDNRSISIRLSSYTIHICEMMSKKAAKKETEEKAMNNEMQKKKTNPNDIQCDAIMLD